MSLLETTEGRPVHYPADKDRFVFDGEVSAIFPDMAVRSIPNFEAAHQAHARMLDNWLVPGASILDIGASRGAFFQSLKTCYPERIANLRLHAVDNSQAMCDYLAADFPQARVRCCDVATPEVLSSSQQYDVVCAHYVLQFVPYELQPAVLKRMFLSVRPGGVFIFGHKGMHYGKTGELSNNEYIRFRVGNGYSAEEIAAKSLALKGSMFPLHHQRLVENMQFHFREIAETFRFMMFSTLFAVK